MSTWDYDAIDRLIHEPVRLGIMTTLAPGYLADFTFLRDTLQVSDGNLSTHLRQLEDAGYIKCTKEFFGRRPKTTYMATDLGRSAYESYIKVLSGLLGKKFRHESTADESD